MASLTPALSCCLVQISSAPPNLTCPFLSPQVNGHIWTYETCRSLLLNAISPLLSRTFHSAASGKEEKNRTGRHRSFPVTIWAEALFPLRVGLFHSPSSLLISLCSLIFTACYETAPPLSRSFLSSHSNFYLQLGHAFYILNCMIGRDDYCLSLLNFPNYVNGLWFLDSIA